MSLDTSGLPFAKPSSRVDRLEYKRALGQQERRCRAAVKLRDKGRCAVPKCGKASAHMHHLVYRSLGGTWQTSNICSICVLHHELVHAKKLRIHGNADQVLAFEWMP